MELYIQLAWAFHACMQTPCQASLHKLPGHCRQLISRIILTPYTTALDSLAVLYSLKTIGFKEINYMGQSHCQTLPYI